MVFVCLILLAIMRRVTSLLLLSMILLPACEPASDDGDSALPNDSIAATPYLPPAIIGEGGPLEGSDVNYVESDTATTGYLAVAEGDGPFPALVIIHEWNGLVDRVRQMADDFAAEGYVTLAADLYEGRTGTNRDENMALVQEARGNMDTVIANLDAALDSAGVEHDLHIYDAVDHGFWLRVDEDPQTRTEPARDAWVRLKDYLTRTLSS